MAEHPIVAFFTWWNAAMREPGRLTEDAFARFFAPDGRLIVNGALRATGPAALALHYRAIAARCEAVAMLLPVDEAFAAPSRAFVHCRTRAVVAGQESCEEAMAYAVLDDAGRMALLRVVAAG